MILPYLTQTLLDESMGLSMYATSKTKSSENANDNGAHLRVKMTQGLLVMHFIQSFRVLSKYTSCPTFSVVTVDDKTEKYCEALEKTLDMLDSSLINDSARDK